LVAEKQSSLHGRADCRIAALGETGLAASAIASAVARLHRLTIHSSGMDTVKHVFINCFDDDNALSDTESLSSSSSDAQSDAGSFGVKSPRMHPNESFSENTWASAYTSAIERPFSTDASTVSYLYFYHSFTNIITNQQDLRRPITSSPIIETISHHLAQMSVSDTPSSSHDESNELDDDEEPCDKPNSPPTSALPIKRVNSPPFMYGGSNAMPYPSTFRPPSPRRTVSLHATSTRYILSRPPPHSPHIPSPLLTSSHSHMNMTRGTSSQYITPTDLKKLRRVSVLSQSSLSTTTDLDDVGFVPCTPFFFGV
jgi:hypothetical protein